MLSNTPTILAIILNWRQPDITIECVHALHQSTYKHVDILIIDNGSDDGSETILCQQLPNTHIIALPKNLGFAKGCNLGLQWAEAHEYKWALLINNDAFVTPSTIAKLMNEAESDVALLSPKVFYDDHREVLWFAGGRRHPHLLEMRDTGQGEQDAPKWQGTRDVDYLVGAGLLVNLTAVAQVGLLNETYFMYYEDMDWSIRLQDAGFKLRLVGNAHLYHRVSFSSGGHSSPTHLYYLGRSSIIFFAQHASKGQPLLIIFFRLGSIFKKIFLLLCKGNLTAVRAYLQGILHGWQERKKGKE